MSTTRPKVGIVVSLCDAQTDHHHVASIANRQIGRSLNRIAQEIKAIHEAQKTVDTHIEYAEEANGKVRALRPSVSGRRTDLGEAA